MILNAAGTAPLPSPCRSLQGDKISAGPA